MSEFALERARAKVRRRRRKPRGPRPPFPWWMYGLWLAFLVSAYLRDAMERRVGWGVFDGVMTVVYLAFLRSSMAWRQWERQEGLSRPRPSLWDGVLAAWPALNLCLNLLWLAGVR